MTNLATLPPDQRAAIEQDKAEWFEAWSMVRKMTPEQIKLWLYRQSDPVYANRMREKLKTAWRNNSGNKPI